jgi:hypothetical protein
MHTLYTLTHLQHTLDLTLQAGALVNAARASQHQRERNVIGPVPEQHAAIKRPAQRSAAQRLQNVTFTISLGCAVCRTVLPTHPVPPVTKVSFVPRGASTFRPRTIASESLTNSTCSMVRDCGWIGRCTLQQHTRKHADGSAAHCRASLSQKHSGPSHIDSSQPYLANCYASFHLPQGLQLVGR